MSTANATNRRSLLPAFNLLLASGAIVLAVVAIAADDVAAPSAASATVDTVAASPAPSTTADTVAAPPAASATTDTVAVDLPCGLRVNTRC